MDSPNRSAADATGSAAPTLSPIRCSHQPPGCQGHQGPRSRPRKNLGGYPRKAGQWVAEKKLGIGERRAPLGGSRLRDSKVVRGLRPRSPGRTSPCTHQGVRSPSRCNEGQRDPSPHFCALRVFLLFPTLSRLAWIPSLGTSSPFNNNPWILGKDDPPCGNIHRFELVTGPAGSRFFFWGYRFFCRTVEPKTHLRILRRR